MADPTRPDAEGEPPTSDDAGPPSGMPRWLKVLGLVVGIGILLLVVTMMNAGGQHGPGRHAPGSDASADRAGDAALVGDREDLEEFFREHLG
ncbi:MAG: hypothetical protein ACRDUY_09885 [Nitriliruptorales bacterium]